ncbi:MAG: hypothetical protein HRU38_07060 [Saccharospirillaceae bacterium]|nr:hypothetical protein [Saccharospirillaceae bacterium]
MATVSWKTNSGNETKKHIEGCDKTLCGIDIPSGHEWSVYGVPECKRCIKRDNSEKE